MGTLRENNAGFGDEKMDHSNKSIRVSTPRMQQPGEAELIDSLNLNAPTNEFAGEQVEMQSDDSQDAFKKRMNRINAILTSVVTWSFLLLTLMFLASIVFGILYSGIHYHGSGWHDAISAKSNCVSPYGAILGAAGDVFGYSNCIRSYDSKSRNNVAGQNIESGLKWDCMEFARRYWMLRGTPVPATFDSVVGAADIWALNFVRLMDGSKTPLLKYPNGLPRREGGSAPRVGDLLIYPRQRDDFPFGHVAVIVGVTENSVLVAEQNWDNKMWPGPYHNHSREIHMLHSPINDAYNITEENDIIINGWMRYTTT
ncbi:D-alanyl-glycyl endopeptidase-like protein [Trypanosoma cruzi marinkellei]|uniref:D-alanyl-glycyl endopeptidase-like protein n=1 Tax=Trypanosoma cruzi marinkellei TaxID=85056 RepID=K2MWE5_TRYCR|nr:D-alanyl-glycyl endopeptidase-like protein [Trypanosoma cruzi marinkellei]